MKIKEYRELIRALLQVADDWHACVSCSERLTWADHAARLRAELESAGCAQAKSRDIEMRELALRRYRDLVAHPMQQQEFVLSADPSGTSSKHYRARSDGASRAAGYNKAPARAVRLSRAARGAMRRGYF